MQKKCVQCGKKAVISLAYGPHAFCKEHFLFFFEKRVRRTVRENRMVRGQEKIVVAYSGGKDSSTALFLVKKIFGKSNPVEALLIDEGIPKYRGSALAIAKKNCKKWKVPCKVVSFKKEFGFTMVDVMRKTGAKKKLGSTCSFCGVLRRRTMNKHARAMGAGKLVTGHNLDDETQSILMNVFDADIARFSRLGPIVGEGGKLGFVPRIKPLCLCPEKEIVAFAAFVGIKYYGRQCCPFKWQAKRNDFRKMVQDFEGKYPGTMFSIVRFFEQAKPVLAKQESARREMKKCAECGEPCSGTLCGVCRFVVKIKGKVN
jgi:uncharacterized protein (TIGR00269 family)